MGGGSSPPAVQNPNVTAGTQQQFNTQAGQSSQSGTELSQNQTNPFGNLSVGQIGVDQFGNPIYGSNLSYNPTEQGLFNTLTGTQQAAGSQGQNLIQGANYGSVDPTTAIGNETSGIQGGLMNQWLSSQEPWYQLQSSQLDTTLRNQGLAPGNPAYDNAMKNLVQGQTQGVAGAASQFEPQAFSQATSLFTLPATLGMQLSQFGQPTSPGSSLVQTAPLSISPADYTGAVNQAQQAEMQAYVAQQQANSAFINGLFGLGGKLGAASILAPSA